MANMSVVEGCNSGATKRCPDCNNTLPTSSFNVDQSKASGRSTYCKVCLRKKNQKKYANKKVCPPIAIPKVRLIDKVFIQLEKVGFITATGLAQSIYKERYPSREKVFAVAHALKSIAAARVQKRGTQYFWYTDAGRIPTE